MPFDQSAKQNSRRHERVATSMDALFRIDVGRRQLHCKIIDMSEGGAGLSHDSIGGNVPIGAVGRLIVPGLGETPAQIRWATLGKMGISFMHNVSMFGSFKGAENSLLKDQQQQRAKSIDGASPPSSEVGLTASRRAEFSRRQNERYEISLPATLWLEGGEISLGCKVVDISVGGAGLTYETIIGPLPLAGEGHLIMPNLGEAGGQIRWTSLGRMGVAFKGAPSTRAPLTKAIRQLIADLTARR